MPPVGADHKAGGQSLALPHDDFHALVVWYDACYFVIDPDQIGQLGGALLQRRHQCAIFNIVAERVETDFIRGKPDLRRADQAAGIIHKTHYVQRRRLGLATRPDIETAQQVDRAAEQGGSTIIAIGDAAGD